ncbi:uncharacterized protein LOC142916578 isoform X2 [Petromyzon marinus]|uniref:uncharacterized protein LOC142916578 isoform X2 n=1 Tax=Petromyzon marinus TaxID=7757 RepID=UPI003F6F14DA
MSLGESPCRRGQRSAVQRSRASGSGRGLHSALCPSAPSPPADDVPRRFTMGSWRLLQAQLLLLLQLLPGASGWPPATAPPSPMNVRVQSRDLLSTLCWEDGGDTTGNIPPLVQPSTINFYNTTSSSKLLNVTYRVEYKLYGEARWRSVCAVTAETRCDVSSALRLPGHRYYLRVRSTISSSPSPQSSPLSSPWVVLELLPLKTTVLSAPTVTLMLHKKVTVDEAGGEEECRVEDDDDGDSEGRGGDDDHDDDGDRGGDDDHDDDDDRDDDGDHDDDDRDDDDHDDDDDRDDDDYRDIDGHHDDREEGEAEWWELFVGVSMRSGWRRRMERRDVLYHLQAEVSTRGGTTSTERFVGCRYRHTVPPLRGAAEYCIRVRIVADYPRWKTGEWSPMSCVSFPPPHSTMGPPISVWATGDAVSEGDTATLRCGVSQNPDSDPI